MVTSFVCFDTAITMYNFITCISSMSGNIIFPFIHVALLMILLIGWSMFRGINTGMLISGFFSSLIGIGFYIMTGQINPNMYLVTTTIFSFFIMFVGAGLTITEYYSQQ